MLKQKESSIEATLVVGAVIAGLALAATAAHAGSVSIQNFTPSAGSSYVFTENAKPDYVGARVNSESYRRYTLGVNYNYLNSPLLELDETRTERVNTLVTGVQTFDLTAGVEWSGRFSLNVQLPLSLVSMPSEGNQFAPGDLRVFTKMYMNRGGALSFALIPELRLGTGDATRFASDNGFGFGVTAAFEHDFGPLSVATNIGYRRAENAVYREIDYRNRLPVSLGLNIPVARRWSLNGEASAQVVLPVNRYQNPSDLYAGAIFHPTDELAMTGGISSGSFNGVGSGDFRVVLGLRFAPISSDPLPLQQAGIAPKPQVIVKEVVREAPPRIIVKHLPARVFFTPKEIDVRDEILFEHNSDVLTAPSKVLLGEVADVMKKNRTRYRKIKIEGHTNELGGDGYNLRLSARRAAAVKTYLATRGIQPTTLETIGYGKRYPKMSKSSGVSKETRLVVNRRVKFRVIN